jgi:hypothetical protein
MIFWDVAERDLARLAKPLRESILAACRDLLDDWSIGKSLAGKLSRFRVYPDGKVLEGANPKTFDPRKKY